MVTTHFMDEAGACCDRIGLVYRGKLIASGTPDDLKAQAADEQADPTMEQAFITHQPTGIKEHTHEVEVSLTAPRACVVRQGTRARSCAISSWLIVAVVIPLLLLFIFGYGINLDSSKLRVGILLNSKAGGAGFHSCDDRFTLYRHATVLAIIAMN